MNIGLVKHIILLRHIRERWKMKTFAIKYPGKRKTKNSYNQQHMDEQRERAKKWIGAKHILPLWNIVQNI